MKFGEIRDYLHVHVADVFTVELTVYERRELRMRPRSSTDGKPIDRFSIARLEALLATEHTESWERYLDDGTIDGLDETLEAEDDDAPRPGPFDGLLADGPGDPLPWPVDEIDPRDEDLEDYDPLPGFEDPSAPAASLEDAASEEPSDDEALDDEDLDDDDLDEDDWEDDWDEEEEADEREA